MKITPDVVEQINSIYYVTKNKAETARRVGCSASTVSKYIIKDWKPEEKRDIVRFDSHSFFERIKDSCYIKEICDKFSGVDNYGELCILSEEEREEIKAFWEELSV